MDTKLDIKANLKILTKFMTEPNEIKRYILMQLWLSQLFTNTIIKPVNTYLDNTSDGSINEVDAIFNVFRTIKANLQDKNQQLDEVRAKMQHQLNILKCMNSILELNDDNNITKLSNNVHKISAIIDENNNMINKITNMSEASITKALE